MVDSIAVVGTLARCALFLSVFDLKDVKINEQQRLIWKLLLYGFELFVVRKVVRCGHSTITRWFKKFTPVARISMISQDQAGRKKNRC